MMVRSELPDKVERERFSKLGVRQQKLLEDMYRNGGAWPIRWVLRRPTLDLMKTLERRGLVKNVVVQGIPRWVVVK